ncbi:MAG TPA: CDP-alcohol phosphatidyltransferase family protein [Anaerolineales bacterium]|nr:CDP-alcohol phosphatidyltransferase family protein [Anaerolineales bacterium]
MEKLKKHTRVNDILLGPLERPALQWLAAHMPAWVTPDICTATGIAGALLTMVSYLFSNYSPGYLWLASLGFIVNWFGDSLDGTLARYRRVERPRYGFYIDHMTDVVCQVMILLGLGLTPYVSFNVACLALISYLLLSVLVYVRTYVVGEFKISYGGLGPTESRVIAVLLNTSMYFFGQQNIVLGQGAFSIYDLFVAGIALLLLSFFLNTSTREARRLAALGE